jgi:TPR repeat protein
VHETNPDMVFTFGNIRKDLKKAHSYLKSASDVGNLNARYNMGVLHLSEATPDFSFSKAYDHFKFSASKGHTLSAYNLAVMNYLGVGTYKSCVVAKTFYKHVIAVGE